MRCKRCEADIGILEERCGTCGADPRSIDIRPSGGRSLPSFQQIVSDSSESARSAASFRTLALAATSGSFERVRAAQIEVEATTLDVVNLGLLTNRIPLVQEIRIRNGAERDLEDGLVRIWLAPNVGEPWEETIPSLAPGEIWTAEGVTPPLDLAQLAQRSEAEQGQLRFEVREEDRVIHAASQPVRILATNEWIFLDGREWSLASYVFPNHSAVEAALGHARRHLEAGGWGNAFDGYQGGEPEKVRAMLAAVHDALMRDFEITYVNPPASFETTGQKIFLPAEIEKHRRGTCLDLALFMAGILERAGLAPIVFLIPGHAFAGVWTHQRFGGPPVRDDEETLRSDLSDGSFLAIEATGCAQAMSADDSIRLGGKHVEQWPVIAAIDVEAARKRGALPIALPGCQG